jgi:6-pyruvoyltetrahydropterin/6-carboxytetrahydropterin synthase
MTMQRYVRVTKRFTFEMAHALRCHDGLCAQVHGHSYVLDVTLRGIPANKPMDPKDGMVIDFADLKRIVRRAAIDHYDHALVLHDSERSTLPQGHALFARTYFTFWQPTCELLLLDIVQRLRPLMPADVELVHVRLQETATSWADWEA